jgi:hypothetical protein
MESSFKLINWRTGIKERALKHELQHEQANPDPYPDPNSNPKPYPNPKPLPISNQNNQYHFRCFLFFGFLNICSTIGLSSPAPQKHFCDLRHFASSPPKYFCFKIILIGRLSQSVFFFFFCPSCCLVVLFG